MVAAVTIIDGCASDSPQFSPLIKQTVEGFKINEVSAEMAYSSRENLEIVDSIGGIPIFHLRKVRLEGRLVRPCGKDFSLFFTK